MGDEDSKVVLAVSTSPKTAAPVMVTVPVSVALSKPIEVVGLTGEAKCVAVSGLYASKL